MSLILKPLVLALLLWAPTATTALAEEAAPLEILLFGDSLAAGYGLEPEDALAHQLEESLSAAARTVTVHNGGVSGDTTAGGLSRLSWTLQGRPDLVIVVLGGNDAMRGLTPSQTEGNLDRLIKELQSRDLKVLLTGMRAPPNLGADYAAAFEPMFARLAQRHDVALYPFILDGVAANPKLNQADGIHPNAEGVAIIVDGLAPLITNLLGSQGS